MGWRNLRQRLGTSVAELDRSRLSARCEGMDVVALADAPLRRAARVGGEITRVVTTPTKGLANVEITISDGTGELTGVFTGRRAIPGLTNGRAVVFEGVTMAQGARRVVFNPAYTLLPH